MRWLPVLALLGCAEAPGTAQERWRPPPTTPQQIDLMDADAEVWHAELSRWETDDISTPRRRDACSELVYDISVHLSPTSHTNVVGEFFAHPDPENDSYRLEIHLNPGWVLRPERRALTMRHEYAHALAWCTTGGDPDTPHKRPELWYPDNPTEGDQEN